MSFGLIQPYIPSEDKLPKDHWSMQPAYLKEKAEREGREYVMPPIYENSQDTVERLIVESQELRNALRPDPVDVGHKEAETQGQQNYQKAVIALKQAVKDLSRFAKQDNILHMVREALEAQ